MAESIQTLADELARLNKNSTLWAQPQNQAQPKMQDYMMQQYAYANPGSVAPAHMYADPRAANYALQQQHYLNPYQARFYGGEFAGNMPGAEYQTSSRMGIYRQGIQANQPQAVSQPGLLEDLTTLHFYRSYAGYENPYKEQIEASRRMVERKASALAIGGTIASIGTVAMSGLPGLALGALAIPAAMYTGHQFMQRQREVGQIYDVMQDLVSGSAATGLFGKGVGMRTSSEMMREMRIAAAADPHKAIQDYQSVFETGAATGLFNFEDSSGEIMSKLKQATKMVNTMMMLAEDPDLQSTVKRMAEFQSMGVSLNQMERMTSDIKAFASLANSSFEEVMSQGASVGAQQMQMMGGSAAFGMRAGGMAMGMANRMMQSGALDPLEAARRGGKSGIMQTMSSMMTNQVHSILGSRAAYIMNPDGSLNEEALGALISGQAGDAIGGSISNFNNMNKFTYLVNQGDVVAKAQSKMSEMDTLWLMEEDKRRWMHLTGIRDENAYYYARGGESGAAVLKYMMSDENKMDLIRAQEQVGIETESKRYAEANAANFFFNTAARKFNMFHADVTDWKTQDYINEALDREASNNSGGFYRAGRRELPISRRAKQFLRQHLRESGNEPFAGAGDIYMETNAPSRGFFTDIAIAAMATNDINPEIEDMLDLAGVGVNNSIIGGMTSLASWAGIPIPKSIQYYAENLNDIKLGEVQSGIREFRDMYKQIQEEDLNRKPGDRRAILSTREVSKVQDAAEDLVDKGILGFYSSGAMNIEKLKGRMGELGPDAYKKLVTLYNDGLITSPKVNLALDKVLKGAKRGDINRRNAMIEEIREYVDDDYMKDIGGTPVAALLTELASTRMSVKDIARYASGEGLSAQETSALTERQHSLLKKLNKTMTADQKEEFSKDPTKLEDMLTMFAMEQANDTTYMESVDTYLTSAASRFDTVEQKRKKVKALKEKGIISERLASKSEDEIIVQSDKERDVQAIAAGDSNENIKRVAANTGDMRDLLGAIVENTTKDSQKDKTQTSAVLSRAAYIMGNPSSIKDTKIVNPF